MATGNERFAGLLESADFQMVTNFKYSFIDALKQYYFVGGMPEAVLRFSENRDFSEVREIQKRILDAYGTVFPLILQKKIKNLFMGLSGREQEPRTMKWQLCGFLIVVLSIKSAG